MFLAATNLVKMDMFDCFLPSSDYFPVDLEDIEPLLPSNSMQIQDLFPSTDFYNFRFNESSSNNALINLGFDEPMSSSQNVSSLPYLLLEFLILNSY